MNLTLLLDLDDTLLDSNFEAFLPAYFQALSKHLAARVSPEIMLPALMSGTKLMMENKDFTRTLKDVFDSEFYPRIGIAPDELAPLLDEFYNVVFPSLVGHTRSRPDALSFVDWALKQGFRIAIATDPLFPAKAAHHRVRWAGLDPEKFELVSSYEQFHFTKTYPAYYAEVLGHMGWPDGPLLMAGNDLERDILPARRLGLAAYHVHQDPASGSGPEAGEAGNLSALRLWLESADLSALEPQFKSPESATSILSASPAVLHGMSLPLDAGQWSHEPAPNDWAFTEIICHLRDTECEIHQSQIQLFSGQNNPFIPRPDTGVWASERNYLNEDGRNALLSFSEARRETLMMLQGLSDADWARPARHAIFGPTNFLEVIKFMADHDRLHIQQAWKTLNAL